MMMRVSIASAALWLALASPVSGQSLGLTPAEIERRLPQQVMQFELNVSNDSDTPVAMRGSVMDSATRRRT
jgi:P pilus assembly chaperone PapD